MKIRQLDKLKIINYKIINCIIEYNIHIVYLILITLIFF